MIVQFNKKSIQTILKKFWKKSYRTSAPPCTHELLKSKLQKMRIFFYQKNVCHSGSDLEKAFCTIMVFKIVSWQYIGTHILKYVTCLSTQQIYFGKYLVCVDWRRNIILHTMSISNLMYLIPTYVPLGILKFNVCNLCWRKIFSMYFEIRKIVPNYTTLDSLHFVELFELQEDFAPNWIR